jgi:hypothetical protein
MHPRFAAALLCTATLTACNGGYFGVGSGDGDGGGGGTTSDAQGIWTGTTSDRYFFNLLVTPDNQVWALSYDESFNTAQSLFRGTGSTSGRNFTGTGSTFATGATGTVSSTTVTGTVTSASSFDGNLGQNVTFTSAFSNQYDTAAALTDYAGTWVGRDSTGSNVTFTIQSNGSYTASATVVGKTGTCAINGSFTTTSFGKNYTNASASFGGSANCADKLASQSLTQGVGVRMVDSDTTKQPLLLVETANTGRTVAWYAYARKQVATP